MNNSRMKRRPLTTQMSCKPSTLAAHSWAVTLISTRPLCPCACDFRNRRSKTAPGCLIRDLDLKRPIYEKTAYFGHFGRTDPDFTWEQPKKLVF